MIAQSTSKFQIENKNIKSIFFEAEEISNIKIKTQKGDYIKFTSSSEGDYKDDLYFDYEVKNSELFIKSRYPERLSFGDNKMTSMLVFAVSVELIIPEHLSLEIVSKIASIEGEGIFNNLIVNTKSGSCELNPFFGNAIINTYEGNINIETKRAEVIAVTQNGELKIESALIKTNKLDLRSVNGNIKVMQME